MTLAQYTRAICLASAQRRAASLTTYHATAVRSTSLLQYNLIALQKARRVEALEDIAPTKSLTKPEREENRQTIRVCLTNLKIFLKRYKQGDYIWTKTDAINQLNVTRERIITAVQPGSLFDPKITENNPVFSILSRACAGKSVLMPEDIGFPAEMTNEDAAQAFSALCDAIRSGFIGRKEQGVVSVSDGRYVRGFAITGKKQPTP